MAEINLATKYSKKISERLYAESFTTSAVNRDYDFDGVNTIKIWSVDTMAMNDYKRTGFERFGSATDIGDTVQTFILTQDRSFTGIVDKANNQEQMDLKQTGVVISRQMREKAIPEIDTYRLATMTANAGTTVTDGALTKTNIYEKILDANAVISDALVPESGRIMFVSPKVLKVLKLDEGFIKAGDLSQSMLITGQVGEVDGIAVVKIPSRYLPANVNFLITHPIATLAADTLKTLRGLTEQRGVDGVVIEGHMIYDAFVNDNYKDAIYVSTNA